MAQGEERAGQRIHGKELNLIISGNGWDLSDGVTIRMVGERVFIDRDGSSVARLNQLPLNRGWSLHHMWNDVLVVVEEQRLTLFYDGQRLYEKQFTIPITSGHVGAWTQNSHIQLARATIFERIGTDSTP
jgi:hypothetical protein